MTVLATESRPLYTPTSPTAVPPLKLRSPPVTVNVPVALIVPAFWLKVLPEPVVLNHVPAPTTIDPEFVTFPVMMRLPPDPSEAVMVPTLVSVYDPLAMLDW